MVNNNGLCFCCASIFFSLYIQTCSYPTIFVFLSAVLLLNSLLILAKSIDKFGWISSALGCLIKLPKIGTLKAIISHCLVHSLWTWCCVTALHGGPLKRQSLWGGEMWKIGYPYMSCELCSGCPILLSSPPSHPCRGWQAWHLSALG